MTCPQTSQRGTARPPYLAAAVGLRTVYPSQGKLTGLGGNLPGTLPECKNLSVVPGMAGDGMSGLLALTNSPAGKRGRMTRTHDKEGSKGSEGNKQVLPALPCLPCGCGRISYQHTACLARHSKRRGGIRTRAGHNTRTDWPAASPRQPTPTSNSSGRVRRSDGVDERQALRQ